MQSDGLKLGPDTGARSLADQWIQQLEADPEWAFRAYRRLLDSLSPDVQERLRPTDEKAEPYVVVYGNTQVGKTTLLMELMGISPAHLTRVSTVLRGDQDIGRSATATAMEYRRAQGDRWGLRRQTDTLWYDSDRAMQDALAQLRQDMESDRLRVDAPCMVHIPQSFFMNAEDTVSARILDLPGPNACNPTEQQHVERMARTYVPFADLILLVGKADSLGFLKPGEISLPGIEDWQSMPRRFRVITTYSYSLQTIKELIRQDPQFTITKWRKRLISQIETFHSLSDAAKEETLYFPLEFGKSWHALEHKDTELYERLAPMVEQLRQELMGQIKHSTSRIGRIRSTLDTHLDIRSLHERKRLALENNIAGLGNKESELLDEMVVWHTAIERVEARIAKATAELENPYVTHGEGLLRDAMDGLRQQSLALPSVGAKQKDREGLQRMIQRSYAELTKIHMELELPPEPESHPGTRKVAQLFWAAARKNLVEPDAWEVRHLLDHAFTDVREQLDSYLIDRYVFASNYKKDKDAVITAHKTALNALLQRWFEAWKYAWQATIRAYEKNLRNLKAELRSLCELRGQTHALLTAARAELNAQALALTRLDATMQEDLQRCQHYLQLLDEEYLAALQHRLDRIVEAEDDVDALSLALGSIDFIEQRKLLVDESSTKIQN